MYPLSYLSRNRDGVTPAETVPVWIEGAIGAK